MRVVVKRKPPLSGAGSARWSIDGGIDHPTYPNNDRGMNELQTVPDAARLFSNSWNYLQTLRQLSPADEARHSLRPGVALLIGFAIELALKAVLSANGWDDKAMRKIGHDLHECLARSIDCGLVVSDAEGLSYVLDRCAEHHHRLTLRYIPRGIDETKLPTAETAIRVIDRLQDDILAQFKTIATDLSNIADDEQCEKQEDPIDKCR
jgi:hypothetical protein